MLTRDKKNNWGFTYIELMVSIAIIAVLSVSSIALFSGYKKTNDVRMAALKLASDIRQAQDSALSLKAFKGSMPTGGWGVNMQTANNLKYIVFADIGSTPNYVYDGSGELHSAINISRSQINSITVDGNSYPQVNITFEPPDPATHICTDDVHCSYQSATILLKGSTASNATSTVVINNLGLVEVN